MSIGGKRLIIENNNYQEKCIESITLIAPITGKLFFERKLEFQFCNPQLMPLRSQALEYLEEMQSETCYQSFQKRTYE